MAVVAMAAEAAAAQLALEYTAVVRSTKRREERPQQNVVETSITPADVYTYVLSPPVAAPAAAAAVEPPPQSTPLGPPSLLLLLLLLAPAGTIKTQNIYNSLSFQVPLRDALRILKQQHKQHQHSESINSSNGGSGVTVAAAASSLLKSPADVVCLRCRSCALGVYAF